MLAVVTSIDFRLTIPADVPITTDISRVVTTGSDPRWTIHSIASGATFTVVVFKWNGSIQGSQDTGMLSIDIPDNGGPRVPQTDPRVTAFNASWRASSPQLVSDVTAAFTPVVWQ